MTSHARPFTYILRLLEDQLPALPAGTPQGVAEGAHLPAANRLVYVAEGGLALAHPTGGRGLVADEAWIGAAPLTLVGGPLGARLYRWELVAGREQEPGLLGREPLGTESRHLLESSLELDPAVGWMLRCDRVDFPKGGMAYEHVHQGPGIRCCLRGEIRVESGGHSRTLRPGDAWFERGPDPVTAFTSTQTETAFVRGMVLPRANKGKSSIRYVRPEDQAMPKLQRYRVFCEEFVEL